MAHILLRHRDIPDIADIKVYKENDGFTAFKNAVTKMTSTQVVDVVKNSGLRGRGGAGFPTGMKWSFIDNKNWPHYVVANADESEPGTFKDREIMEGNPFQFLEGLAIASYAVGANVAYVYLRGEFWQLADFLDEKIAEMEKDGWLGDKLFGGEYSLRMYTHLGAGAYICGEETSMLESLEGKRGEIRPRPPLPAIKGLFGQPTIVNNVISLASVPIILEKGAAFYRDFGVGKSRGTVPIQLAGNIKRGGLIEKAFGVTLKELLYDYGGGSASGRPIRTVQAGGPLGAYMPPADFDTPVDYEAVAATGAMLGHGGLVVFDDTVDMAGMARFALEFCAIESCGKCTPCRIGSTRGVEIVDRLLALRGPAGGTRAIARDAQLALLAELCDTMVDGSLCGLGGMAPFPVRSAVKHFPEDFLGAAR
jgi:formate dehydrogenase iron-sulfur subunit